MGKTTETLGDLLDASFESNPTESQLDTFMAKPREASANADEGVATRIVHDLLGNATTRIIYDLDRLNAWANRPLLPPLHERPTSVNCNKGKQTKVRSAFSIPTASDGRFRRKFRPSQGQSNEAARLSIRAGSAVAGRSSTTRANRFASTSLLQPTRIASSSSDASRRQPGAVLRSRRARRRHAAPEPYLGESRLRPWQQDDLRRQRHCAEC